MIHHVGLETDPALLARWAELWEALGFERVEVPERVRGEASWFERGGTQIHLLHSEPGTEVVPPAGHVAVVARDYDEAVTALEVAGFEVSRRRDLWGARRAKTAGPGGHLVEVIEAPPSGG